MACRFESYPVNKILLFRSVGRLTAESLAESYQTIRKHSTATDARMGIWDLSSANSDPREDSGQHGHCREQLGSNRTATGPSLTGVIAGLRAKSNDTFAGAPHRWTS